MALFNAAVSDFLSDIDTEAPDAAVAMAIHDKLIDMVSYGDTSAAASDDSHTAFGALVALLTSLLNAPLWLQVTVFLVVSLAALFLTRPLVKKYVNGRTQPTNADMLIGREK